jgi:hypothetical protein
MTIAKYIGRLHHDKYFERPDLDLFWDLELLHRKADENESGFNNRLDEVNNRLKKNKEYQSGWFGALGFNEKQISVLSSEWKVIFQPKSHLFLYKSNSTIKIGDEMPVYSPLEASFIWVTTNKVYTWLSGDNMNYRFRLVSPEEVEEYGRSLKTNDEDNNSEDNSSVACGCKIQIASDGFINMCCPHCGKKSFLAINKN